MSKLHILIVENLFSSKKIDWQDLLQKNDRDYQIVTAANGAEGLVKYDSEKIDSIVLDYTLPDFDGLEFVKKLKAQTYKLPPMILLYEPGQESDVSMTVRNQFHRCLVKDRLSFQVLQQAIARLFDTKLLRETLVKKKQQQQLIADTALRIRKSLSLKFILQTATQEILDFLACDRVSIVRLTQQDIRIESQSYAKDIATKLPEQTAENFHLFLAEDIREVVQSNEQQLLIPILLEQAIETNLYYPLWGWLMAETVEPRQWLEQECTFLQQFVVLLGIAFNQKLLYKQLEQSDRQLRISVVNNQHLKKLTLKDSLTQVYNRRYFKQQLNKEWFRLRRISSPLSIILCDVDCFKLYNDTYGHQSGDLCLQKIAEAMSNTLQRAADILARYGGEEFVAILPDTDLEGAIGVAEKIRMAAKELQIPHRNSSVDSVVTVSVGVATTVPHSRDNPKMLVQAADNALYLAKNRGRDCVAVHRNPIALSDWKQKSDLEWAKRIRHALKHDLFHLYVQPIASLKTDPIKHFEILLRLEDRGEEVFGPGFFFDAAERNCLMSSIDTWVINQLLKQIAIKEDSCDWLNYQFSINLSGASLNDRDFLDFLSRRLVEYHLSPRMFCFEITEDIAINNIHDVCDFIVSLKELGCSFSLDDFGKGMSSLTYLKNLPLDYLKIDGSFITELNKDKASMVMVEAIDHLATGIGLKTIAEYVENQETLNILHSLNIDYAQGYHLGRPQKFTNIFV